jgi:hypothetical protein
VYETQLSGWRPDGIPQAHITITWKNEAGTAPGPSESDLLANNIGWESVEVASNAGVPSALLEMVVQPFVGGGNDPRLLGVRVARIIAK